MYPLRFAGPGSHKYAENHNGKTELRGAVTANCHTGGYTGDTYCLGCNAKITSGTSTDKNAANHDGGTKKVYFKEGETGYEYYAVCLGCGEKTGETGVTPYNDETFEPSKVEWDYGEEIMPSELYPTAINNGV